ncbi:MAG: ribosome maturation factor RimP [Erysipelotrichaceae bacterium]|nr:ribosome maturation factor RimP [Erysipelotrichaceae bacterium]
MSDTEKIKQLISPVISELSLKLYDVEWTIESKQKMLRISITDQFDMIDLDMCSLVSEKFSSILDQQPDLDLPYILEVCSPGAERELKKHDDILAALDQYVYVKLKEPKQGLSEVIGFLKEVNDDHICISYKDKTRDKTLNIQINNIAFIRLAIKF